MKYSEKLRQRRTGHIAHLEVRIIPYLVNWLFANGQLPPGWGKNVQPQ